MQKFILLIAGVIAVGIAYVIAVAPNQNTPSGVTPATSTAVAGQASLAMADAGTMTFSVPEMHCEFSCFPRVKKTLEKSDLVEAVELAPQKEEGTVDNRQVIVHFKPGFELKDALARLEKEGFTDSAKVDSSTAP